MANHLASLGFFLRDAQRTSEELAERLEQPLPPSEEEVAQLDPAVAGAAQ